MDVDPTVSRHEIRTLVGAFNQEKALVEAFFVIVKSSWTFVWSSFTNCHLHSCLRPWCGLEERIWWNHEYEYEESRSRQTSLTGLDRQLASRTSNTTQIFFSAALFISLHGARPPAMGLARSDSSVSRVWWLISLAQAGPSSRKVGVTFLTLSLDDNR